MDVSIGYALPILPVNQYLDKKESAFCQTGKGMPVVKLIFIAKKMTVHMSLTDWRENCQNTKNFQTRGCLVSILRSR